MTGLTVLGARDAAGLRTPESKGCLPFNNRDQRSLVDKCDYLAAPGRIDDPDAHNNLGLPGVGPKNRLNPHFYLDSEEQTKQIRLKSVHRGVTVEQVTTTLALN